MIISKTTLNIIKRATMDCSCEMGGILGSSNGKVVDNIVIDRQNINTKKRCLYEPNVDYLNQNIEIWQTKNISFKGIFHTHFVGVKTLSCGDITYITSIMKSMPEYIEYLYFPIFVLPECELICYKASFVDEKINIQEDILIID